jgi:hypothetical protein
MIPHHWLSAVCANFSNRIQAFRDDAHSLHSILQTVTPEGRSMTSIRDLREGQDRREQERREHRERGPWWVGAAHKLGPMNLIALAAMFFLMWLVAVELRASRAESAVNIRAVQQLLDTHINQAGRQQFYLWRICAATTTQSGGNAMIECGQAPGMQ